MSDINLKETLQLPVTKFPMKAGLAQREPKVVEDWIKNNLYEAISKKNEGKELFFLPDGPPYANGSIHIGHALNKVLKDVMIKSKRLSGFDARFVPGWDCHGLPIELNVEKKHGKPGVKLTPKEFRQKCREYAQSQIELQKKDFQRLGVVADWDNPYITMSYEYEANTVRALAKIVKNGHLRKGHKPVYWCLDCGSSLAEAEVEYKDKTSDSIDVMFNFVSKEDIKKVTGLDITSLSFAVWTTTPWTLPANEAVALGADIDYVVLNIKANNQHIVIAKPLIQQFLERTDMTEDDVKVISSAIQGEAFEGIKLKHPFYNKQVPIILGEHVTTDSGTGAVHTAPAHGVEDYQVGIKYNLPMDNPVGVNGAYKSNVEYLAGIHIKKANSAVIDLLKKHESLLNHVTIQHSYPHCWRHKTPLIFLSTPQWFISMETIKDKALKAIDEVEWMPSWGKNRIKAMTENRPDWCISRQRTWGVPLCLVVHNETGELHPEVDVIMQKAADEIEKAGIDAWYDIPLEKLIPLKDVPNYYKINDILDVWFDSGVVHYATQNHPGWKFPANLYLEGSDQHRGWFNSSLMTSIAMNGVAPYQQVLTHGFVVDANGHKMSKSLGNVISPSEVVNNYGADVLRLWVSATDFKNDVAVSNEIFNRFSDSYRRIRNTLRFLLANLHDFEPIKHTVKTDKLLALDLWLVNKAAELQDKIKSSYEKYELHAIYQEIQNFCVVTLGSFYLDVIKDRQYTCYKDAHPRRSAQTAIYHVLEAMTRWISPILSFTAEEVWGYMPPIDSRTSSVFLSEWYTIPTFNISKSYPKLSSEDFEKLLEVRSEVNKSLEAARNEGIIGSGLQAVVHISCDENTKAVLEKFEDELHFLFITSDTVIHVGKELTVTVHSSDNQKCERCWHYDATVGVNAEFSTICSRCVTNLNAPGENRKYV